MVECSLCMREVLGSVLSISTFCKIIIIQVFHTKAELVLLCKRMFFSWGCSRVLTFHVRGPGFSLHILKDKIQLFTVQIKSTKVQTLGAI